MTIESNLKNNHLVYLINTKAVQSSAFLAVNNSIIHYFDWDNRLDWVEISHCRLNTKHVFTFSSLIPSILQTAGLNMGTSTCVHLKGVGGLTGEQNTDSQKRL